MTEPTDARPWTEAERLEALHRYAILDTPPEEDFDDLVRLASDLLGAPIAAVSLVDAGRQWFKAETGFGVAEMPIGASICARAMLRPEEMVFPDLRADPRFAGAPLVAGEAGIRFYAGEVLATPEGLPLGALCVLDTKPRPEGLTERQRFALRTLARQVMSQMELRRVLAGQRQAAVRNRQLVDSVTDYAILGTDLEGRVTRWNTGARNLLGWTEAEMLGEEAARIFTPEDRRAGAPAEEMAEATRAGRASDERWHLRADGSRFMASGELMPLRDEAGLQVGYVKVLRDRTREVEAKGALSAVNERYRLAARATRDAVWDWDLRSNGVLWNEALEVAYGWAPARVEPTGDWWIARIHPEDRERVSRSIHDVIDGAGTSWTDEYRFQRADGSYASVLDRGYVIRDAAGAPLRMIGAMLDLSERQRAGAALREADERLRLATAAARIGTFDYHAPTGALNWDDRCRELFGLPPGVPVTYEGSFLAGLHPEDRDEAAAAVGRVLTDAGARTFRLEYRTIGLSDGVLRWVQASGEAFLEAGRPVRLIGTVLDISDRKRAEEALRDSEARYRTLFNSMDEGFCIIEFFDGPEGPMSDYVHVEANPGYERHSGISGIVGRTLRNLVPPEEAEGWVDLYGGVLRNGEPIRFERDFVTAGRFIEVSAFRVDPPERRQVAVLFQDITERKRAQAALEGLNAGLEQQVAERTRERDRFWRLSRDPFLVADAAGRWLHPSPAWTDLLGWTQTELTGRTSEWMEHPDDRARTRTEVGALAAGETTTRFENRFRTRAGDYRWFSWTAVPAEGGLTYCVARDVTEEKAQAEAQVRLEEQLRQSQKMEAVGQLTGGIAHDFNNLLTGITGSLELLGTRMAQGRMTEVERYVTAAQGAARRAAALTHRLLAFSRRQTLDPRPTNVNRLTAGMEELVRRTVGPEIAVEVVSAVGLWAVLVDPHQLENALLNLCINARDAMPGGGRLTIETANKWLDDRAAAERDLEPGQYISLCVTDTGTGMPPDVIARAFDPFFTTKPIGQGTGLGLSMIYGFVRQSGGQVRIYSEVGQGTTMCLYLPRHYGDEEGAPGEASEMDASHAGRGETVLVVDDEPSIRMLVTEVLDELGYTAIEAADGAAGLKILRSDARIDLLVTDVGLPGGMNGRQMADAARVFRPDLRVLFITGYAENAVLSHGHLAPGMHVLTKPFAMEMLAARIRELITAR